MLDCDLFEDGYLPLPECAERLGLSEARVQILVQTRVLKSYSGPYEVMVQPAIIRGVTT